jgi:hypothetical protein
LKLIIASVIILFGVVVFLFALFPSDMSVSRFIRINAPKDSVLKEVSDLRTWKKWNELIQSQVQGDSVKINHTQADSNRIDAVNLKINLIRKTADSVITDWEGSSGKSFRGKYIFSESGGQVVVEWTLEFHLHWYPWEKLASMFYDKELGPEMELSLTKLQNIMQGSREKLSKLSLTVPDPTARDHSR